MSLNSEEKGSHDLHHEGERAIENLYELLGQHYNLVRRLESENEALKKALGENTLAAVAAHDDEGLPELRAYVASGMRDRDYPMAGTWAQSAHTLLMRYDGEREARVAAMAQAPIRNEAAPRVPEECHMDALALYGIADEIARGEGAELNVAAMTVIRRAAQRLRGAMPVSGQ